MSSISFLGSLVNLKKNLTVLPHSVGEWWSELSGSEYAAVVFAIIFTLLSLFLACLHSWCVYHYVSNASTRSDLYWVVFMCPTVASCATVSMAIPKAATFLLAVAFTYLMMCMFVVCSLTVSMCGGLRDMSVKLCQVGVKINPWQFPFACCFAYCLPKWKATEANIRRIQWVIFSSVIIRVMLEIMNVVVFLEIGTRMDMFFTISQVFSIACTIVGFYGSDMLIPIGTIILPGYRLKFLFKLIDYSQLAYTIYRVGFDLCVFVDDYFVQRSSFWSSFILTLHMLIVSSLATHFLRPTQTALFDMYPVGYAKVSLRTVPTTTSETPTKDSVQAKTSNGELESNEKQQASS
ncbi:Protein OSTA-1 [Aphelenchoides avenae]|nr:Protein OSTA-1 [Aphelenchus avenae]